MTSSHDEQMIEATEMQQLNILSLSHTDWKHFLTIIEAPDCMNKNLKKAVKKFRKEFERPCCINHH